MNNKCQHAALIIINCNNVNILKGSRHRYQICSSYIKRMQNSDGLFYSTVRNPGKISGPLARGRQSHYGPYTTISSRSEEKINDDHLIFYNE